MTSPIWIWEALARTIHDDQIARYGGSLGIRDESLFLASLDSACGRSANDRVIYLLMETIQIYSI